MFYTCNTCVDHTPVVHMCYHTCNTGVRYTPVLHMWNMWVGAKVAFITYFIILEILHLK